FLIDHYALALQLGGDASHPIRGPSRREFVAPLLERQFLRRWRERRGVQAGPIQAEQVGLCGQRQLPLLQQLEPFSSRQRGVQLFFSPANWVDSLPMAA